MAVKKVYFHKVTLTRTANNEEVEYHELREIISDIINENAQEMGIYQTLDLTYTGEGLHTIMDVRECEGNYFFGRISKQRQNNSLIKRNYVTYEDGTPIPENEIENSGIEAYTFFCYSYDAGVFAIVSAMGAPNEDVIGRIFTKYNNNYSIEMIGIPNPTAIESIYNGRKPEISKIEIEVPVPPMAVLQEIFHWNREDILAILHEGAVSAKFSLQAPFRRSITHDEEDAKGLIDIFREYAANYRRAKMTAKTSTIKSKEYDLHGEMFSYRIDVPLYQTEGGNKIDYTLDELTELYREHITMAMRQNLAAIRIIIGR